MLIFPKAHTEPGRPYDARGAAHIALAADVDHAGDHPLRSNLFSRQSVGRVLRHVFKCRWWSENVAARNSAAAMSRGPLCAHRLKG